jgi:hypothetical protein
MRTCADLACPCHAAPPSVSAVALHAAAEAERLRASEPELFPLARQWSLYTGEPLAASLARWRAVRDSFQAVMRQMAEAINGTLPHMERLRAALRDAGQLREEPPADPRARALWARGNRSTGPPRPAAGRTRRPRTHPGTTDRKGA